MPTHITTGASDKSKVYAVTLDRHKCIQKCFHRAEDCESELKIMQELDGQRHFPRLIKADQRNIWMRHHGTLLRKHNCPSNYKDQLLTIMRTLEDLNIYHNDFWRNNVVVDSAGTITLIDFGFGSWQNPGYPYMNLSSDMINKASSIEDLYRKLWSKRAPMKRSRKE